MSEKARTNVHLAILGREANFFFVLSPAKASIRGSSIARMFARYAKRGYTIACTPVSDPVRSLSTQAVGQGPGGENLDAPARSIIQRAPVRCNKPSRAINVPDCSHVLTGLTNFNLCVGRTNFNALVAPDSALANSFAKRVACTPVSDPVKSLNTQAVSQVAQCGVNLVTPTRQTIQCDVIRRNKPSRAINAPDCSHALTGLTNSSSWVGLSNFNAFVAPDSCSVLANTFGPGCHNEGEVTRGEIRQNVLVRIPRRVTGDSFDPSVGEDETSCLVPIVVSPRFDDSDGLDFKHND